jgi:flagellar biosynthesis/type III secretory pathway protein FliH
MMTFEITTRTIVRASVAIALVAATCAAAFFIGQNTRLTEATATDRVKANVERTNIERDRELKGALSSAKAAEQRRVGKINDMWRGRITRIKRDHKRVLAKQVESARQAGIDAGYSSGSAAGYSSGREEGVEEGIDKASDELTCSDDMDVDLPFSNW